MTNTQIIAGSDEAIVKIVSSTSWTGSIIDSSFDSATKEGRGPLKIPFVCSNGLFIDGIYSLVFQKLTDHGILTVSVYRITRHLTLNLLLQHMVLFHYLETVGDNDTFLS